MFVVIDRKQKVARVEGLTIQEACWLGYYFVRENPELVKAKWCVVCFDKIDAHFSRDEHYTVPGIWSTFAREVAKLIENPPIEQPVHDCPDCGCPPEKCCK